MKSEKPSLSPFLVNQKQEGEKKGLSGLWIKI
jgi:hypothetical protein